jgi:hypothetical protein
MLVVATDVLVIASNAEAAIKRVGIRMALGGYCPYVGRMKYNARLDNGYFIDS